jgi:hypothetical protein
MGASAQFDAALSWHNFISASVLHRSRKTAEILQIVSMVIGSPRPQDVPGVARRGVRTPVDDQEMSHAQRQ